MAPETLGVWLKRLRSTRDLTQELLAEEACCAAQTIRMIESGRRRPSREMAERLADVLAVPAEERAEFLRMARLGAAGDAPLQAESHLPRATNALIGRDSERDLVVSLITQGTRVISITGPGGAGKTRLALDVAIRLAATRSVVWIDLAPLQSANQVPAAIGRATGVSISGQPVASLVSALQDRELVIVLDNLEHVIDSERLIDTLVAGIPGLQIIITSRTRPHLAGSRVVGLDGLTSGEDAIRLFVERAQQVDHTFSLETRNLDVIAGLCRAVGGLPLAIELAAARINVLTPVEIAAGIEHNMDVLNVDRRDVPDRQRGPRAVFDHSWKLLTREQQTVLARLSIFRGGCTLDAAEQVAGATLPVLSVLVDASLVRVERSDSSRYAMHELVRQCAAEQLENAPETRQRHTEYFASLVTETMPKLHTRDQAATIRRLEPDLPNIHAAWVDAINGSRLDILQRMSYPLAIVHEMRGTPREGVGYLEAGVNAIRLLPDPPPAVYAQLLTGYGWLQGRSGNVPAACDLLGEAVELLGTNDDLLANTPAAGHLGLMLFQSGRLAEARTVLERTIGVLTPRKLTFFLAMSHLFLSMVAVAQGQIAEAESLARRAIEYANQSGSQRAIVLGRAAGAIAANARGDLAAAMAFIQEGMAVSIANRDRWGLAFILTQLGDAALKQGDLIEAGARLREAIDLLDEIGEPFNHCRALIMLGDVEAAAGNYAAAQSFWTEAHRRATAAGLIPIVQQIAQRTRTTAS